MIGPSFDAVVHRYGPALVALCDAIAAVDDAVVAVVRAVRNTPPKEES